MPTPAVLAPVLACSSLRSCARLRAGPARGVPSQRRAAPGGEGLAHPGRLVTSPAAWGPLDGIARRAHRQPVATRHLRPRALPAWLDRDSPLASKHARVRPHPRVGSRRAPTAQASRRVDPRCLGTWTGDSVELQDLCCHAFGTVIRGRTRTRLSAGAEHQGRLGRDIKARLCAKVQHRRGESACAACAVTTTAARATSTA